MRIRHGSQRQRDRVAAGSRGTALPVPLGDAVAGQGIKACQICGILWHSSADGHLAHGLLLSLQPPDAIELFEILNWRPDMQFFQSFYSLGYSGIVLLLTTLFVTAFAFSAFGLQKRSWPIKAGFVAIMFALFVLVTNFLAEERKVMMDAIRDEGGLKRTQER